MHHPCEGSVQLYTFQCQDLWTCLCPPNFFTCVNSECPSLRRLSPPLPLRTHVDTFCHRLSKTSRSVYNKCFLSLCFQCEIFNESDSEGSVLERRLPFKVSLEFSALSQMRPFAFHVFNLICLALLVQVGCSLPVILIGTKTAGSVSRNSSPCITSPARLVRIEVSCRDDMYVWVSVLVRTWEIDVFRIRLVQVSAIVFFVLTLRDLNQF